MRSDRADDDGDGTPGEGRLALFIVYPHAEISFEDEEKHNIKVSPTTGNMQQRFPKLIRCMKRSPMLVPSPEGFNIFSVNRLNSVTVVEHAICFGTVVKELRIR